MHIKALYRACQPYLCFDCCSNYTACLYRWCALECGIMQCYALCAGCVRCCCRSCSLPCTPRVLEQPSGTPFTTTRFAWLSQVSLPAAHVWCPVCSRLAIGCLCKDRCVPSHLLISLLRFFAGPRNGSQEFLGTYSVKFKLLPSISHQSPRQLLCPSG